MIRKAYSMKYVRESLPDEHKLNADLLELPDGYNKIKMKYYWEVLRKCRQLY